MIISSDSKRRRMQFTLRGALLVMLGVAVFLAAQLYLSERSRKFETHRDVFPEHRDRGEPSPYDGLPVEPSLPVQIERR